VATLSALVVCTQAVASDESETKRKKKKREREREEGGRG